MDKQRQKTIRRKRRRTGIRKKLNGTPTRPRMAVRRSLNHIYVQVIDDLAGKTICAASSREKGIEASSSGNAQAAKAVGKAIADRAKEAGISEVAFDRGGYRYQGRVKALADAAREGGLKF